MVNRNNSAATVAMRLLQHGDSEKPVRMSTGTPTIPIDNPTSLLQILPVKEATTISSVALQIHWHSTLYNLFTNSVVEVQRHSKTGVGASESTGCDKGTN